MERLSNDRAPPSCKMAKRMNQERSVDTHSICSIGNPNLGVLPIADVATENAGAIAPPNLVTRMPNSAQSSLQRRRRPAAALARFARRARW